MRFLLVSPLLFVSLASSAQISSQVMPVSTAVTQYRPVQTVAGVSIAPQTASNPAYGIAAWNASAGQSIDVIKYGDFPCEFDGVPTPGNTAVPLAGMCHDSGVLNDIGIANTGGVVGKIMRLRPDLGANFAEVTIGFPGRRGSMVAAGSFDPSTVPAYIQANQTPQVQSDWNAVSGLGVVLNKPTIPGASVTYYNGAGVISAPKVIVSGPITTAANGAWTFNYAAAGCSTLRSIQAQAVSPTGTVATQQYTAYYNAPTTTAVSGTVYSGAVLALLGATIIPLTAATTVYVEVVCT